MPQLPNFFSCFSSSPSSLSRSILKLSLGGSVAYAAWRYAYVGLRGKHRIRIKADFLLDIDEKEGFDVMSDPLMLNPTTPWWFNIVPRSASDSVIKELKELVLHRLQTDQDAGDYQDDREFFISYWIYFGRLLPVFWKSAVAAPRREHGLRVLSYRQALGPYGWFYHAHKVGKHPSSSSTGASDSQSPTCLIQDTIEATVWDEPLADAIAGFLLTQILSCRGEELKRRYGGECLGVKMVD
mmetsp:Transcript_47732/g.102293  ORF Transcript_47732/g.102293 Transcript_47732/m.102293 type:complete len:240 (+) Transcript_47732:164-883(+)|eukprot:CAMPEP_0206465084 /NCGR_PEP_ID=MMETSP0324_2-20121206/27611_1 /ASSEMBLY_ACC=CAM_ASM_000836 /TAXON_ID=2866 /ORGANISM="Crypthecodinium cohnii, Strain Seligo" /LENGTH=239 /DNA_ID=CAMNT_0053937859 /DNA_START=112 /DNA_END=831 /DNA_ORIENTATION=-